MTCNRPLTQQKVEGRSATMISDCGDNMFDKTMYLLEHNENKAFNCASALYKYFPVIVNCLPARIKSSTAGNLTFG